MKKIIFSAVLMTFVLTSCNQKTKEETNTTTTIKEDRIIESDSVLIDKSKMETAIYACPMHSEVQGKLNDKCSKCGMPLTELVPTE